MQLNLRYIVEVDDAIRNVLAEDGRIAYALVFGSHAVGHSGPHSDLDIAIGCKSGRRLDWQDIGVLMSQLEHAAAVAVDLVVMDEAPPGLAYRVFRDGRVILETDRAALVNQQALAILGYLDFKPVEQLCARTVLAAAADGR